MRRALVALFLLAISVSAFAQSRPPRRPPRTGPNNAATVEIAIKDAAEQLASIRKQFEKDLEVLRRLRLADEALSDPMQPSAAIQKAFEEVSAVQGMSSDFYVRDGVIKMRKTLEDARRSPGTADFGRLRSLLRDEALVPASRVAVRNAAALGEEMQGWIKVQVFISDHLRQLTDLANESLKAAERE